VCPPLLIIIRRPPSPPLFPYTTLFRSVAGSKTAAGCPDTDLDSVADAEDRCPSEAGAVAMQGCPDRDNDVVADIDDACPDVAGRSEEHTSELQSREKLVCRLLLEKKKS